MSTKNQNIENEVKLFNLIEQLKKYDSEFNQFVTTFEFTVYENKKYYFIQIENNETIIFNLDNKTISDELLKKLNSDYWGEDEFCEIEPFHNTLKINDVINQLSNRLDLELSNN